ncbi:hypothetical protein PPSC2_26395 (plasmid) [Paenibacillus polymyxa SC2]|uniref:Uncharacterized protein n=1 Tax=Paenibacillus polymyxa (strain SC2) TaxID=886882 RepID=A0A0D5ZCL6_PAEPS|nr:hypothetical protein PPSC2_26395 [Paenibacillus polymyxa SC2]
MVSIISMIAWFGLGVLLEISQYNEILDCDHKRLFVIKTPNPFKLLHVFQWIILLLIFIEPVSYLCIAVKKYLIKPIFKTVNGILQTKLWEREKEAHN